MATRGATGSKRGGSRDAGKEGGAEGTGQGGQGREAPEGTLDGPVQPVPRLALRVVGPIFVGDALRAHRARQQAEGVANLVGLVFTNRAGQPLDARHLLRRFKVHLRRAGLVDRPFHALRHSAATFLLLQGVDLKVVQEILGHSNMATTSDRYSHVRDGMKRSAMARLDELWGAS